MKNYDQLLDDLKTRMGSLDNYLNSKEQNRIQHYISEIEGGLAAMEEASEFMVKVPAGDYDSNRKKYRLI